MGRMNKNEVNRGEKNGRGASAVIDPARDLARNPNEYPDRT